MLKTVKRIQAERKDARRKIPNSVQRIFPLVACWEDGTFQHKANEFSRCWEIGDINYLIGGQVEQDKIFGVYQSILSALGPGATFKITTGNRHIPMAEWQRNTLIAMQEDGLDLYREEYNNMLRAKIAAADGIRLEHYLTVTTYKSSYEDARAYFNRISVALVSLFQSISSRFTPLDACSRLRLLHDFFWPGQEDEFYLDFSASAKRGHSGVDLFAPSSIEVFPNYLKCGDLYVRALFAIDYGAYASDNFISRITSEIPSNLMISVDVVTIPTEEAQEQVQLKRDGIETSIQRWQTRQNRNNNFSAEIPYPMRLQREANEEFLNEITRNGQAMNVTTLTVVHVADSLEKLNQDTERLQAIRDARLIPATFQQTDALVTALPLGVCRIDARRTLLTKELACISMPFRVQEISEPGGIWHGENALSRNLILCNQKYLQNPGTFILGVPGSGKSMAAKEMIAFLVLATRDTILINDPEGEYSRLVRALGGTVVKIKAGGADHINAMDMVQNYGEKNAVAEKSQYIQTLFEQMESTSLTAQEHSLIDRCVGLLYANSGGKTVTLNDLRVLLAMQPETVGQKLALTLERFTVGSMDAFTYPTNVDMTARILSFDLSEMRQQLRPIGQMVIADALTNRVTQNWMNHISTHVFTDEIQEFFKDDYTFDFFDSAWRKWRKRDGCPVAITQNVSVLLNNDRSSAMLANSETVILLNQSDQDERRLETIFRLPPEQMQFVRGADYGCGLLLYGGKHVPFINRFPSDTQLYRLMTTKPGEGGFGDGDGDE